MFRATAGLQQRFGPQRVFDTPLAETLIAGMAIGMAVEGLKPVAEIQFLGFVYATIDQIVPEHGTAVIHSIPPISLSFDHRTVTGGEAARFLKVSLDDLEHAE